MLASWLRALNELLRGDLTRPDDLARAEIRAPARLFACWALALGASYGFFMGWYALFGGRPDAWKQLLASTLKLPLLFLLTLCVTLPSLYVFNTLIGFRLAPRHVLRLLVGAIVVNLAVGASLGPILAFFTLSTTSYSFMIVLNVALLAIGGLCGLGFLLRTLRGIRDAARIAAIEADASEAAERARAARAALGPSDDPDDAPRPLFPRVIAQPPPADTVFRIWLVIYSLVGAQMAWILRPFIGNPRIPFAWFRPREGNFFSSVLEALQHLVGL
jgi:hypothetical protein